MSTENTSDFENLREKFGRFRILIVGRANAGKTTILRAICNTTENPEIYDGDGKKVCIQVDVCRRVYAKLRD
jgi:GTPase SAR1 family protein